MSKDKGLAIPFHIKNSRVSEEEENEEFVSPPGRFSPRNVSSKYDFVKVKVWLGENADHYYVLSRFLLCRTLTVTKIPNHVAIKIALELKKLLVDNSLLDVSQSDLEANLFKLMERRGYGEEYRNRYKMMTRFHHQRVPLVILVCGTACVGKSTIATQLAQRLNLPNVLQTDMVYELLRTSTELALPRMLTGFVKAISRSVQCDLARKRAEFLKMPGPCYILKINPLIVKYLHSIYLSAPLASSPVWGRDFSSSEELITEFCRECRIVRKGLGGDLKKAMKDGKPIIIEGIHLDPSIYLWDEDNKLPTPSPTKEEEPNSMADHKNGMQTENDSSALYSSQGQNKDCFSENLSQWEGISAELNKVTASLQSVSVVISVPGNKGVTVKDPGTDKSSAIRKEKSGAQPIIVPIVLKMADFDHEALLEEWISTSATIKKYPIQDKHELISNLKIIEDYLCSFDSQGLAIVNVSATTFPQTLDWLHNYLLQCIEQGTSASGGNGGFPGAN